MGTIKPPPSIPRPPRPAPSGGSWQRSYTHEHERPSGENPLMGRNAVPPPPPATIYEVAPCPDGGTLITYTRRVKVRLPAPCPPPPIWDRVEQEREPVTLRRIALFFRVRGYRLWQRWNQLRYWVTGR